MSRLGDLFDLVQSSFHAFNSFFSSGALLGVQCAEYGLPGDWLARLELRETLSAVADDLLIGYGGGPRWRERYPGN